MKKKITDLKKGVRVPTTNFKPKSTDSCLEIKDTLACLLHIYRDKTFGDLVWRKSIEEKAHKLINS